MADREPEIVARIARGVSELPAAQWDALAGSADPFLSHAFLSLLEESGSVGEGSGWTPLPILVERGGRMTAAAPAYLKTHSQGEYVFDHGWADAWERAGRRLLSQAPGFGPLHALRGQALARQRSLTRCWPRWRR